MGKEFKEMFKCSEDHNGSKFKMYLQIEQKYRLGRWESSEHERFLRACYEYKNDWEKIEEHIKTRSIPQIRSHAQKYLIKLSKRYRVKLSQKKFLKSKAKHLALNYNSLNQIDDISKMNKYDKNIFDMFKYYKRDFFPGKSEDASNNEDSNTAELTKETKYSFDITHTKDMYDTSQMSSNNKQVNQMMANSNSVIETDNYPEMDQVYCKSNDCLQLLINFLVNLHTVNDQTLHNIYLNIIE